MAAVARPGTGFLNSQESPLVGCAPEGSCAKCNLRETCLSVGVPVQDLERVENVTFLRRRVRRGDHLFVAGDRLTCVYAVLTGFFKTSLGDREGRDQVTGFQMAGDLLGMDGLGSGHYKDRATALEDSDVCAMPYPLIEQMAWEVPSMQHRLHTLLANEIVRGKGMMLLLGSMSAEERLAMFLVNLSRRLQQRGYSASSFVLRMTRHEIGSYLGIKLETVSRLFSAFQRNGLIDVRQKEVCILDIKGLEDTFAQAARSVPLVAA